MFHAIAAAAPDLFFWLGDNIYADTASSWVLAEDYRRQRAVPSTLPLMRTVPQLAIWDDHDFGLNNSDRSNPMREATLAAFRNYWANPGGGLPECPGVFFQYAYGGVDFFFLDGRYYRTPNTDPDGPDKTLLGNCQGDWLRQALLTSRAPFKVLICGSGWSSEDGPTGDTWGAFLRERDALFDFIRDRGIEGVFCLSGDTHFGEVNCIPWSVRGGYDFYDFVSSPLAQATGSSFLNAEPELRIRSPYFRTVNFGAARFRMGTGAAGAVLAARSARRPGSHGAHADAGGTEERRRELALEDRPARTGATPAARFQSLSPSVCAIARQDTNLKF